MLATSSKADRGSPLGRVFDVSRGCVDDGPGLRTVIFLKGCALACGWCHNPEGRTATPEIAFRERDCIGCGRCRTACPRPSWDRAWREGCRGCGSCAAVCPTSARRLVGRPVSPSDLVAEVSREIDFFTGTGGGVTFSGGEPLLQARFVFATISLLRAQGIHAAIETAGSWPRRITGDVRSHADLVLFDLKHTDLVKAERGVGAGYELALGNLEILLDSSVPLEVRITLVPGFNDGPQDLEAMALWLAARAARAPVRIQPFHRLAVAKEQTFDLEYAYGEASPVTREQLRRAASIFCAEGLDAQPK